MGAAIASSFASSIDSRLSGDAARRRGARGGRAKPSACRWARPSVHGLPPAQAHAVTVAAEGASLHSFHMGMMIAALLVALGGLVGAAGIRNPKREEILAENCAGGQLVGAELGHRLAGHGRAPSRAAHGVRASPPRAARG